MTQKQASKHVKEIVKGGMWLWADKHNLTSYEIAESLSIKGVELSRNTVQGWYRRKKIQPVALIAIYYALLNGDLL